MSKRDKDLKPSRSQPGLNALGGPAASRRGQFSWALFDWANQPYFTVVTTVIFAPWFVHGFVGDPVKGQSLYGVSVAAAGLAIALLAPICGAIADVAGQRKPWIAGFSVLFVLGSCLLWAGDVGVVMLGLVLASIGMEMAVVFNHAMLPGVAPAHRMGRLSGFAWGLGYFGGIVALLAMMWFFVYPGTLDLPGVPPAPLFGIDPATGEAERLTGPAAALWYLVFAIPLFLFTPDGVRSRFTLREAVGDGLHSLVDTVRQIRSYANVLRFLVARMIYNDGLAAIFAFGGIYAATTFGWGSLELGIAGLIMLVFAGVGAMVGGRLDDALGSKRTIVLSLILLIFGILGIASASPSHVLFFVETVPGDRETGLFASVPERLYLGFSVLLGLGMGPAQSASRTMMARLAPREMMTEFFGLYALSGKASAFLAPALIAAGTALSGDARVSVLVIIVMLVVGLVLLLPVREERGVMP